MAPKKNYVPVQMGKAIDAVRNGEKIATAAQKCGVPRITLYNKVSGKSPAVCAMGPKTIFTKMEEDVLVKWLLGMSERHFPVNREILMESVQKVVTEQGKPNPFTNNKPGKKWFQSFLKRHPEIIEKSAQNLTKSRDDVSEEDIRKWFGEIELYLEERGLTDILKMPNRIFNADESAFFLSPKAGRVLCKRGEKHLYNFCRDEKENLTVLLTANAAGQLAPPMIVFKYEGVPAHISATVPEHWGIGKSESGWMCGSTFYEYITNIFNPWLEVQDIQKPVLFFVDGHKSHLTLHLSNFCSANGIEIIALYPNSTHILQPMDLAVFRPLKVAWRKEVSRWQMDHIGQILKKEHFGPVLQNAVSSISEDCIRNGFRAGGLHPFGPDYIDMTKIKGHQVTHKEINPKQNGFIEFLETEIVKVFSREKLELFNKLYFKDRNTLEQILPSEDESLYVIWAKKKEASLGSQRIMIDSSSAVPEGDYAYVGRQGSTEPPNLGQTSSLGMAKPSNFNYDNEETLRQQSSPPADTADVLNPSNIAVIANQAASEKNPPCTTTQLEKRDGHDVQQCSAKPAEFNQTSDSGLNKYVTDSENEKNRQTRVASPAAAYSIVNDPINISDPASQAVLETLPSCSTAQRSTPQKHPLEAALGVIIPSPFKNNLFWPEEVKEKKKRKKEKIPYAVTSRAWQQYHIKKETEKQKLLEEKEKRAIERQEKKVLKENKENKKKKIILKKKNKERRINEDTTTEDSDVTYAESDDSDWKEQVNESMEDNEEMSSIVQAKRRQNCCLINNRRRKRFRAPTVDIGQFVIVKYAGEFFPGKIISVDDDQYEISTMVLSTGNSFKWPDKPDKILYRSEDVVELINDPVPLNKRGFFKINEMLKYLPVIMYNS